MTCHVHFRGRQVRIVGDGFLLVRLQTDYELQSWALSAIEELTKLNGAIPKTVTVSDESEVPA